MTMRSPDLRYLLAPRSIAVVGASDRPGSIGDTVLGSLERLGFTGAVWPIHPVHASVRGHRCRPSLAALPQAPDVAAICLNGRRAVAELRHLARLGGRAAVIYDGGFAETGDEGRLQQQELVHVAKEAGIALCGPNCMGAVNLVDGSSTYKLPVLDGDALRGNVGLVSQSGSVTIGLLSDVRRFGFSHVISTGNEAVVTAGDYVDYLVDDPATAIIALFLESVRDPVGFGRAVRRASRADKPVVVLKVGRSRRAMDAVVSHTGGLAGASRVFSAWLGTVGAIEVDSLDGMTEVLAAFQARRIPRGRRIAVVTGSGGHTELVLDTAEREGLDLPPLTADALAGMRAALGHFSGDGNPLDAWGGGDVATNLRAALGHFGASDHYDAVVLCNENNEGAAIGRSEAVCAVFCESARAFDKPHYLLNTRPGLMHAGNLALLADAGAAMIGGIAQGLRAIDLLARWRARPQPAVDRTAVEAPSEGSDPARRPPGPLSASAGRTTIHEYDAKALLAPFGVPCAPERLVASFDAGVAAAEAIGWPVVLKVAADALPHKTEAGLVVLDIDGPVALRRAWDTLAARCDRVGLAQPAYLVQRMVRGGVEVFFGVKRDPFWGPVLAFGIGGVLVELIDEVRLRLLPASENDLRALFESGRAGTLLRGVRGKPAADTEALVRCALAVQAFVGACGDALEEMDLNPVVVLPAGQGCMVVDALIRPCAHEAVLA